MGTCILDLFPDVQQQLDLLMDQSFVTQSYPVAEFIVVFGFLLVLTMEQIVLDYKEQSLLNRLVFHYFLLMFPRLLFSFTVLYLLFLFFTYSSVASIFILIPLCSLLPYYIS